MRVYALTALPYFHGTFEIRGSGYLSDSDKQKAIFLAYSLQDRCWQMMTAIQDNDEESLTELGL